MSRARVLVGSKSFGRRFPEHLDQLRDAGCEVVPNTLGRSYRAAELAPALADADAIVTGTDELTAAVIAAAPRLRVIAKHGVGLDTIDLEAARARAITVTSTVGAVDDSVADHALALLLALARQVVPADAGVRAGRWDAFPGVELRDRTLGIVGLGRIGRGVARRAQAFGMRVVGHDVAPDPAWAAAHGVELLGLVALLDAADAVSLHLPGSSAPLLGAAELARLRPGALLVNTARGSLVDEAALVDALRSGRLAGAGLDVFAEEPPAASPLRELPQVVLTPHVAGQTDAALRRMGEQCVAAVLGGLGLR